MASILDITEYILEKKGYVSTMKLQKLAFYSNALSSSRRTVHFSRDLSGVGERPRLP